MSHRKRLGVRMMRQNLSRYLRRVAKGEAFEVTDRGRAVALLSPIEDAATPLERLVASGRASEPEGDLLELGLPPHRQVRGRGLSAVLEEQRGERL